MTFRTGSHPTMSAPHAKRLCPRRSRWSGQLTMRFANAGDMTHETQDDQ